MLKYNKFIVAFVGFALLLLKDFSGLDLTDQASTIAEMVIAGLVAAGVWAVPNIEPSTED